MKNKSDVILSEVVSSFNDFFKVQKKTVDVTIGLSGGVDSMVLLNVLYQLKTKLNLKLSAIHVHHGLSKNAVNWGHVCFDECKKLDVDFSQKKIKLDNSTYNVNHGYGKNYYKPFYIENYKGYIYIVERNGNMLKLPIKDLIKTKDNLKGIKIKSDIKKFNNIYILDTLIIKDEIFISFRDED